MIRVNWRWLLWFCLFLPARTGAVEVIDGPRVEAAGPVATIRWRLDAPAGGTVRYGLQPDALIRTAKSDAVSAEHAVRLEGLTPGTRYHFSVGTARKRLRDGSFVAGSAAESPPATGPPAARPKEADAKRPPPAAPVRPAAPPARQTWANLATLRDHFDRHGGDFAATSPEDYAAQAWRFLERAKAEGLPAKLDPEGTLRVWDPKSRAFAAYTRQGMTKTYFKPGSRDYFERQPGKPVRLKPSTF